MDTNDDSSICEIHVDQLYRNNPGDIYRTEYDDDEDHQRYHDHQDVFGVFQHDRDRVKRCLNKDGTLYFSIRHENSLSFSQTS